MRRLLVLLCGVLALAPSGRAASVANLETAKVSTLGTMNLGPWLESVSSSVGQPILVRDVPAIPVNYTFVDQPFNSVWDTVTRVHGLVWCDVNGIRVVGGPETQAICAKSSSYRGKLTIYELADSAKDQLGVDWANFLSPAAIGTFSGVFPAFDFSKSINALSAKGLARKIDEISLPLASGKSANFNSGGVLTLSLVGQGESKIERQINYGLTLALTPGDIGPDGLPVNVAATMSNPASVSNPNLLDLSSRQITADVRVPLGKPYVVASFSSQRDETSGSGLPGLSAVPVAGYAAGVGATSMQRSTLVLVLEVSQ